MNALASIFSAVFWGILVLSALVFAHEGGHFLAARIFGMRVTEFFLGLPFRYRLAVKSKRFGTEFGVTPLLLGGYNRICGMEGYDDELLPTALLATQNVGRLKVAELAVALDIELDDAYGLLETLADMGSVRPYYDPELGETPGQRNLPEAYETLQRDPHLLNEYDEGHDFSLEGTTAAGEPHPVPDADEFYRAERAHTYVGKPAYARIITLLAGPCVNIALSFVLLVGSFTLVGFTVAANSNVLGGVAEGSLAETAGLVAGDRIVELGGIAVSDWDTLSGAIDEALAAGEDFTIVYERDDARHTATVDLPEGETVEMLGVSASLTTYRPSIGEAGMMALSYIRMVGSAVARIVMPTHTMEVLNDSSSIVGISVMASDAAASGPNELLLFAAAISLSLGFMNLLPIPPLDGGKILIELIQVVLRRPISPRAQNAVSYVGLAFFLFIFCFAMRNDFVRILGL